MSGPTKRSYHHGDLRRALMAEMTALVDEQGVQPASLRDAARRLGVSEAAPYHHFRSKTDLLGAIAFEGYEALLAAMEGGAEGVCDPFDRLGEVGRAYVQFALDNRGRFRVMFGEQMIEVAEHTPPEVLAIGRAAAAYPETVARAAAASLGRAERAPAVHRVLWSMAHGAATLLLEREIRFAPGEPGVDAFLDDLVAAVIGATRAVATRPSCP